MKFDEIDPRTWPSYTCRKKHTDIEDGSWVDRECGFTFCINTNVDVPELSCPWCENEVDRTGPSDEEADARARIAALEEQRAGIDEEIEELEAKCTSVSPAPTDLRRFIGLVARLPEDVSLRVGTEACEDGDGVFGFFSLMRKPPEGGWKTQGHWSAASSATGRCSSYSKESGLNVKSPDPHRFDTVAMRSVTFDVEDFDEKTDALVIGLLENFLREYRDGDDPIRGGGGEILDP